jgi:hypothetical protein
MWWRLGLASQLRAFKPRLMAIMRVLASFVSQLKTLMSRLTVLVNLNIRPQRLDKALNSQESGR